MYALGVAVVALMGGCGRTSLPNPQPIEPTTPTLCGLALGSWTWPAPQALPDVDALLETQRANINTNFFDPILSEDGLSLYVATDIAGPWDIYVLHRPSIGSSFDQIEVLGGDVNPAGVTTFGYQPLTAIGIAAAFGNYPAQGIPPGTYVIALADMKVSPLSWRASAVSLDYEVIIDPRLNAGGDALIFAASTVADPRRSIYMSERALLDEDFTAAAPVEGLTTEDDSAPWLSPDKRIVLFASATAAPNAESTSEIWSASRLTPSGPFTNASPVPELNSPGFDGEPYVFESEDACEIYIVSWRPEAPGFRIYRSTAVR